MAESDRTIDDLPSSMAIIPKHKYYLTDITIEYTMEGSELPMPSTINVQVSNSESTMENTVCFENICTKKWKYDGVIDVVEDVTFVAIWDQSEISGRVCLPQVELEEILKNIEGRHYIARQFVTDLDKLALNLSCQISAVQLEEEIVSQEHEEEDDGIGLAAQLVENPEGIMAFALELPDDTEDNMKPHLLNLCGDHFLELYRETRSESDISTSVRAYDLAAQLMPAEDSTAIDFQYNAAVAYIERYTLTADFSDIEAATSKFKIAVDGTSDDNPTMPGRLNSLANSYEIRFEHTGDLADISSAISSQRKAIDLTPDGDARIIKRLSNLGVHYYARYKITGDLTDIVDAISSQQKAIDLISVDHADLPALLSNLTTSYRTRFERAGDLSDIAKALSYQQKCVNLTADDHTNMPARLSSLGNIYQARFDYTGDLVDISEAISAQLKAIQLTPQDHEDMPKRLNNLGISFQARFEHNADLSDIFEAISYQKIAIDLTSHSHTDIPAMLNSLGVSYHALFNRTGDLSDISNAISYQKEAIRLKPEGHAELPRMLNNVGSSLSARFNHTGDIADISEAILSQGKAVQLSPDKHTENPNLLSNLAASRLARFQRTGDMSDLVEAVSCLQKAVRLTPIGHVEIPRMLTNLGSSYETRFERTGDFKDISEAIASHRKAIELTKNGNSELPRRLAGLGSSYNSLFNRTGNLTDISEAISYQQKAVVLTPDSHVALKNRLTSLGNSYRNRFERTGDMADIYEAIAYQQQAIDLTPEGHARFEHAGDLSDLSAARSHYKKSTELTPEDDANMPDRLSNLANTYQAQFQHTEDLADIGEAIASLQRAIDLTPEDNAEIFVNLSNIGVSYQARFPNTEDLEDISKAISFQEKARNLCPEGHSRMPIILGNLGLSYGSRFIYTHDRSDGLAAAANHRLAATYPTGIPSIKLIAAKRWAQISHEIDSSQLLNAYITAINLMSQVVGLDQTIQRRHTNLPDISNVSSSAAAAAFELGKVDMALEFLEEGRCLVWNQLNNLRTPVDALRAEDSRLADDLLRVSTALEFAGSRLESALPEAGTGLRQKMLLQDQVNNHAKLAEEWEKLLEKIRKIPHFEDFLHPPSCSNILRRIPEAGIVILINIHRERCDALALVSGEDKPIAIPLADFSFAKAEALRINLQAHLRASHVRERAVRPSTRGMHLESGITAILGQLWVSVVKPILERLGYSKPPSELLRIWWCATGPLAFLPIHAAGIYGGPKPTIPSTLSDFARSSYTPTVRALVDRVSHLAKNEQKQGLFMISQPNTPNLPSIPKTKNEVQAIQRLTQGCDFPVLCLDGAAATVAQVVKNMETHSSIHFACHASQNTSDPLKSGFALQDGYLELSTIIQKRLASADLAFLSACQTSTGDEKLSEEAVHLAAGMLAAGYRGVVATMWSIQDKYGPDIAEDFYTKLTEKKSLNGKNASLALHYATEKLRKKLTESSMDVESSLLAWVPYVHFGL